MCSDADLAYEPYSAKVWQGKTDKWGLHNTFTKQNFDVRFHYDRKVNFYESLAFRIRQYH